MLCKSSHDNGISIVKMSTEQKHIQSVSLIVNH